jgi:hypothetical protein
MDTPDAIPAITPGDKVTGLWLIFEEAVVAEGVPITGFSSTVRPAIGAIVENGAGVTTGKALG